MHIPTILHIEDETDDAFLLQQAFKVAGLNVQVRTVENGARALDYLMGVNPFGDRVQYPMPDLILLDIKMPTLNGFELLPWLREQERFRALPVYILSSSNDATDIARAKELGAKGYLVKMFGFREVAEVVSKELGGAGVNG
jgi:CheY-like chemotaxis protein